MNETGRVLISLKLSRDGTIQDVKLKSSSHFARLDQVALSTVSAVEKYQPLPKSVNDDQLVVEVPIEFAL